MSEQKVFPGGVALDGAIAKANSIICPNGKEIFIPVVNNSVFYADEDYYNMVNVLTDCRDTAISFKRIPFTQQLTPLALSKALKNPAFKANLDGIAIEPVGNAILFAGYYGDKVLTLNVPMNENKDGFEDNFTSVVVAVGKDVKKVSAGDIITYDAGTGLRLKVKDVMDRDLHHNLFKTLKNKDIENLTDRGTHRINRVMLRGFFLIKEHEVIAIRHDTK